MSSQLPRRRSLRRHVGLAAAAVTAAGSLTALAMPAAQAAGTLTLTVTSNDPADLQAAIATANSTTPDTYDDVLINFSDDVTSDVEVNGATPRMADASASLANTGVNDYLDGFGAFFRVESQVPVTIDFGGDLGVNQTDDAEYTAFVLASPNTTITNFTNIRAAAAGVLVGAPGATVSHGAIADPDTIISEVGVALTDGADGTVIDDVTFDSMFIAGVYVDDCATVNNTTVSNSTFTNTDDWGDIWFEFGCSAEDRTEVNGFTVSNSSFNSSGIWSSIGLRENGTYNNVVIEDSEFTGADENVVYAFDSETTTNMVIRNNTFNGTSYVWEEEANATHTGLQIVDNQFTDQLLHSLVMLNANHVNNVITGNTFTDQRGGSQATIWLRRLVGGTDAGNVIDNNTFLQNDGAEENRWAVYAEMYAAGEDGDSGWAITRNAIDGYGVGASQAPITIGPAAVRTKVWGNTFGQRTQGTTVPAESEAGALWFTWNTGNHNANLQTWRAANPTYNKGKVSFDVAPVDPAEGGNQQPTPPLTLHVYWTADDNAEEYLGAITDVTAAGRVSIETTHKTGFIRLQTEGGESGYTSQYSGVAEIADRNDNDDDGLTDAEEAELGTNPDLSDSDGDGIDDGVEVAGSNNKYCATNPLKRDTDGDGLTDNREVNGIRIRQAVYTNRGRPRNGKSIGLVKTNPCARDTDGDTLTDRQEARGFKVNQRVKRSKKNGGWYKITTRKTNPLRADTDGDGIKDRQELNGSANKRFGKQKSDPTRKDTDWGGGSDGGEVKNKTNPARHG